eukprot:gene7759-9934_t
MARNGEEPLQTCLATEKIGMNVAGITFGKNTTLRYYSLSFQGTISTFVWQQAHITDKQKCQQPINTVESPETTSLPATSSRLSQA